MIINSPRTGEEVSRARSFAGVGAEHVATVQSLLVTCTLHGIRGYDYLVDVLQRIDRHPAKDIAQLTPRLWKQHFAANPLRSDLHARAP